MARSGRWQHSGAPTCKVNAAAHTIRISPFLGQNVTYDWRMPDQDHLILTPAPPTKPAQAAKTPPNAKSSAMDTPEVVTLTRIPLPAHYLLFESKFQIRQLFLGSWADARLRLRQSVASTSDEAASIKPASTSVK